MQCISPYISHGIFLSGKSLSLTAITRSLLFYALPTSYTFCTSITLFPTFTSNALANAEFVLYKDGEEVPLTFTKQENGKYKYAPDAEDATATLVTDENGMIDVEGLDVGSYHFEETKAPEGYSINTDGKTLTLTVNGDVATAKLYNEGQLNDTKLSALPSTGGIGTTIFTIAGCVIMIAAAGLFFASRKKSDNK